MDTDLDKGGGGGGHYAETRSIKTQTDKLWMIWTDEDEGLRPSVYLHHAHGIPHLLFYVLSVL